MNCPQPHHLGKLSFGERVVLTGGMLFFEGEGRCEKAGSEGNGMLTLFSVHTVTPAHQHLPHWLLLGPCRLPNRA